MRRRIMFLVLAVLMGFAFLTAGCKKKTLRQTPEESQPDPGPGRPPAP